MRFISADEIDRALSFPALIDALDDAFRSDWQAPTRHHHAISVSGAPEATHLLMPAWGGGLLGVKIVNVFPGNGAGGLPAVHGLYVLQDGNTGETLAVLDGTRLTLWRTAAASALAARRLARIDARRLTIVGSGALAPFLVRAHASVRALDSIRVWNHRRAGAQRMAENLAAEGLPTKVTDDLQSSVEQSDIVSAATLSHHPLILGAWLKPGVHIDLVGAFNMTMREADDLALTRSRVFVDTPAAMTEGGDVALAIASGALSAASVLGDLASLAHGASGRGSDDEITLFKAVGASIEDLAAAALVWKRIERG